MLSYAFSDGHFFLFLSSLCYLSFLHRNSNQELLRNLDRLHGPHHFLFILFIRLKISHPTYPFRAFLEINCLNCSFELPAQLWNSGQPDGSALSEDMCATLVFEHAGSSKQTRLWGGLMKNSGPVSSMDASQRDYSQAPYYLCATTVSPRRMAIWVFLGYLQRSNNGLVDMLSTYDSAG